MMLHPQKCSVLRISNGRIPRTSQYQIKCVTLVEEQSSKDLGVDIQSSSVKLIMEELYKPHSRLPRCDPLYEASFDYGMQCAWVTEDV